MKIFTQNAVLVHLQTVLEVNKIFVQFHCLSLYWNDLYQNDFESKGLVFVGNWSIQSNLHVWPPLGKWPPPIHDHLCKTQNFPSQSPVVGTCYESPPPLRSLEILKPNLLCPSPNKHKSTQSLNSYYNIRMAMDIVWSLTRSTDHQNGLNSKLTHRKKAQKWSTNLPNFGRFVDPCRMVRDCHHIQKSWHIWAFIPRNEMPRA